MQAEKAIAFIRQVLELEAVWYFEVHLETPADVVAVAEALMANRCSVEAFPSEGILKIRRSFPAERSLDHPV